MLGVNGLIRRILRKAGYDIVRYPAKDWMFFRHVMEATLNKLEINCILDVVANAGRFGSAAREIGYKGWLISFEPDPGTFQRLVKTASGDPKWRTFDWALGDREHTAEFNVYSETEFNSLREVTKFARDRYPTMTELVSKVGVPVRRLDQVLDQCTQGIDNPRLYLKIDTQGYDPQVLAGAAGVLERMLGLQTELPVKHVYEGLPSYLESLRILSEKGFDLVDFMPVSRDTNGLTAVELDCVMVRRNQAGHVVQPA
jgi:FkbM family methyltransferase